MIQILTWGQFWPLSEVTLKILFFSTSFSENTALVENFKPYPYCLDKAKISWFETHVDTTYCSTAMHKTVGVLLEYTEPEY